jgi:hypothetical protein
MSASVPELNSVPGPGTASKRRSSRPEREQSPYSLALPDSRQAFLLGEQLGAEEVE